MKYNDPDCPIISYILEDYKIEHVSLDLGVNVNLHPYLVCWQLNLGELKPTCTTFLFVDRSTKVPKGIVKDVLFVDKFIYPVNFIVLRIESIVDECKQIHVTLSQLFSSNY